jgi:hypothetical protein
MGNRLAYGCPSGTLASEAEVPGYRSSTKPAAAK